MQNLNFIPRQLNHIGNSFILRWARDDDVAEIRHLVNSAYRELADLGLNYTATYQDEDTTRQRLASGRGLVLQSDNRIIGTALFSLKNYFTSRRSGYVSQLAIHPDWKAKGLGRLLMDACEDLAWENQIFYIQLDTAIPAQHLVEWYLRRGYKVVGEVQWEGKTYRSFIFEKSLVEGRSQPNLIENNSLPSTTVDARFQQP